ncbi:MAG: VOC family protein [Microthrixaceae bacterium]
MITNVSIISIFCTDLDETRDFYVDVLGFDAAEDISFGDYRWVTVTHPNSPSCSCTSPPPAHRSTTAWWTRSSDRWPPGR